MSCKCKACNFTCRLRDFILTKKNFPILNLLLQSGCVLISATFCKILHKKIEFTFSSKLLLIVSNKKEQNFFKLKKLRSKICFSSLAYDYTHYHTIYTHIYTHGHVVGYMDDCLVVFYKSRNFCSKPRNFLC